MSSNQSGEGEIRKSIIEADLVDCVIALPGQLFRSTQILACLWFLSKGRRNGVSRTAMSKPSLSAPAKWGACCTEPYAICPRKTLPALPAPSTSGRVERSPGTMPMSPASARAPYWRTSAGKAMFSPQAVTWGKRRGKVTAEPFEDRISRLTA